MRIAIGCDHRGIDVKTWVAEILEEQGMSLIDCGTHSAESCDYPDIARQVAQRVVDGRAELGVLICGTGIGMSIAANKIPGVRAALCCDEQAAQLSHQHNNANILCVGANQATREQLKPIISGFVKSEFEHGRHELRVTKINELDAQRIECK